MTYSDKMANEWFSEFQREFNTRVNFIPSSIYLGGGTPTSLNEDLFEEVLKLIDTVYSKGIEYTIEINPETFDEEKARLLKKYHVNRASIGLESSDSAELAFLGRRHTYDDVKNTVRLLNEISDIHNISSDILYSFPHETMESFKKTIDDALALNIKHISLYSLTIEENTVFGKKGYQSFDEDIEANYYETAKTMFEERGYMQYEVSNFALKGYESKHNLAYWHYDDFMGLGMGASSKLNHQREDNTRHLSSYLKHKYIDEVIELSKEDEMFEMIMMGMRLKEGVDLKCFKERFNKELLDVYKDITDSLINRNLVRVEDNHLIANNLEILNSILVEFL